LLTDSLRKTCWSGVSAPIWQYFFVHLSTEAHLVYRHRRFVFLRQRLLRSGVDQEIRMRLYSEKEHRARSPGWKRVESSGYAIAADKGNVNE
jgi:hypothetical protein